MKYFLITFAFAIPAFAQLSEINWSPRLISTQYLYKEPGLMKIEGSLYGVGIKGDTLANNDLVLTGDLQLIGGEPQYKGALQNGTPLNSGSRDSILEFRGLIGKRDIAMGESVMFHWNSGLGFWYLQNDIKSQYGYKREQSYTYIPIILGLTFGSKSSTNFVASFEYDLFLGGQNTTHLNDVDPNLPKMKFRQDSGSGLRLGCQLNHNFDNFIGFVRLDYVAWNVDDSETKYLSDGTTTIGFMEPENETKMTMLSVGATF